MHVVGAVGNIYRCLQRIREQLRNLPWIPHETFETWLTLIMNAILQRPTLSLQTISLQDECKSAAKQTEASADGAASVRFQGQPVASNNADFT